MYTKLGKNITILSNYGNHIYHFLSIIAAKCLSLLKVSWFKGIHLFSRAEKGVKMDVARGLLVLVSNYSHFPTKLDLKNLTSKLWFLLANESNTSIKLKKRGY